MLRDAAGAGIGELVRLPDDKIIEAVMRVQRRACRRVRQGVWRGWISAAEVNFVGVCWQCGAPQAASAASSIPPSSLSPTRRVSLGGGPADSSGLANLRSQRSGSALATA
jgi:hypothetical protein